MSRFCNAVAALLLSSIALFAAETAAPTPPPAGPVFTPYGSVAYWLRGDFVRNSSSNGATIKSMMDYSNRLGYKIGTRIVVNEQITMQFEIGNDWNATEKVNDVAGNFMTKRGLSPYFSQANAKWDSKLFYVEGGVLYVKGSPAMNLIGTSIFNNASDVVNLKNYKFAGHNTWGILTNFNLPGLRLGAPVLKGDITLGIDLLATIIEERTIAPAVENLLIDNYSSIMFILDVPMKMGALTLNAQVVPILNRNFRDSIGVVDNGSDPELGLGFDGGYKLDDNVSFRAGLGYAMLSNKNSRLPSETLYDRSGLIINVGSTVKVGPGKLDIDANYSNDADAQISTGQTDYYFLDLKYGWAVYKGITVMPRARLFMSTTKTDMNVKGRPEIILSWAF